MVLSSGFNANHPELTFSLLVCCYLIRRLRSVNVWWVYYKLYKGIILYVPL
uniref:Uncharacterized protein n=1 Tax=Arundo donax TaxID=35708 RepID=A0A0A9EJU1_ARUDO